MTGLADMQVFCDVPVVPVQAVSAHVAHGGPVWPAFDTQTAARHCRDRRPVDRCPTLPARARTLRRPAVWGGFLNLQFGHLIVEQLTRLPQSLRDRPEDLYLFTLPPGQQPDSLPDWVWQVLDWHGVPRRRVRLVETPICAAELRVAAQGEMMGTTTTDAAYLDLLDQRTASRVPQPDPAAVVFVTRAGLVARGQGGHAGEAYLCDALTRAGVRVVDPVRHDVAGQVAIHAGAGVLVFSEGSALHGRLLLGRLSQDIHVLRRRPNRDLAAEQLGPRCRTLRYHAAVGRRLGARMPGGANRLDLTCAIYDLQTVFDLFASLGHDLRGHWDATAYRAAVQDDLRGWLDACRTAPGQLTENLALMAEAGYVLDPPYTPSTLPVQRHTIT